MAFWNDFIAPKRKYRRGDLVFVPGLGQRGLTGLVINKIPKKDEYKIMFRGFNGEIHTIDGSEIKELEKFYYIADERNDIEIYKKLAKKDFKINKINVTKR